MTTLTLFSVFHVLVCHSKSHRSVLHERLNCNLYQIVLRFVSDCAIICVKRSCEIRQTKSLFFIIYFMGYRELTHHLFFMKTYFQFCGVPSSLLQGLKSRNIFPQYVKFKIDNATNFYIFEVCISPCIGNNGYSERVICRFTHSERNSIYGNRAFVNCEISLLSHSLVMRVFKCKVRTSICISHSNTFGSFVNMALNNVPIKTPIH